MTDPTEPPPAEPLRDDVALALLHAPSAARAALAALFALDARLAQVVRTTATPIVGQMRLAWWREALARLDTAPAPAEPVLAALAEQLLPRGVTGASLAAVAEAWEELVVVEGAIDLAAHARRGAVLFAAAGQVLGGGVPAAAGEGWALADLAVHLTDSGERERAATLARERLAAGFAARWDRRARPMGMPALLAWFDLVPASPARRGIAAVAFRMTGRART